MNRGVPRKTDPLWGEDHPWLLAAMGSLFVGILVAYVVWSETSSVLGGAMGGAGLAVVLFIGVGAWGAALKRRRLRSERSAFSQWTREHPSLSAGLIAALVALLIVTLETLRGTKPSIAMLFGAVAAAIVFVSRRGREANMSRRARLRERYLPNHRD